MHVATGMGQRGYLGLGLLAITGFTAYQPLRHLNRGLSELQDVLPTIAMSATGLVGAFYFLYLDRNKRIASSVYGAVEVSHAPSNRESGEIGSIAIQLAAMESVTLAPQTSTPTTTDLLQSRAHPPRGDAWPPSTQKGTSSDF